VAFYLKTNNAYDKLDKFLLVKFKPHVFNKKYHSQYKHTKT